MQDSSLHGGRPAEPDPASELAGRLLRRAHGGVGVIDAGWAQRRFAYTTDWIAERFAVLGLLNARYGTVDNRAAATSTALPIVHGSFARTRFSLPPNESTPQMSGTEASPRTTDNERSLHTAEDRELTPGREPLAAEISEPSPNIGDTTIAPIVQSKSATLSPDAALLRMEAERRGPQKSQPSPPQKAQPASVHESVLHDGMERSSSHEPPGATVASESVHQPYASDVAPDSANTKQSIDVLETVTRPRATVEPTLHVDARAEAPPAVGATASDSIVMRESSELNPLLPSFVEQNQLPASPEQQLSHPSQTAKPLPLHETATMISRTALEASDPLAMRDETVDRGGGESESRVSGPGDPQGRQSATNSVLLVAGEQTAMRNHSHLGAPLQQRLREPAQASAEHRSQHDQGTLDAAIASSTVQADGVREYPPVSAPEVFQRSSSLSGARMIWRKDFGVASLSAGDAPRPGVPRSYSPQSVSSWETLQRAEATAANSSAVSANAGSFAPAASTQSEAGGIDLEQITEHVSRVILRRVSVERERRGIGRWL